MVRDGRLELPTSCSQSKRATNCANPGFLVIEFCSRCGQTCGQAVFLTISACGGSACIAGISRDCGHGIFRLEGGATRSQTRRDTNFAIPGYSISVIIPRQGGKSKIFLSVVIYAVKAAFVPFSATGGNPANAGVARICVVSPCPVPDTATALPNQARYQLRYTRIYNFCHYTTAGGKVKDFSVCGYSCGQSRFCVAFSSQGKFRKRRRHQGFAGFCSSGSWIGPTHSQNKCVAV